MQQKGLAYALVAALAGMVSADGDSDVAKLTKSSFGDFVKANDLVLAECEHLQLIITGACCSQRVLRRC